MTPADNPYARGKIYRITTANAPIVYIGSTTNSLVGRLASHLHSYAGWQRNPVHRFCASYLVFDQGDYRIELLEDFPCANRAELCRKEQEYIQSHYETAVNKLRAHVTAEDKARDRRKYYLAHRDRIIASVLQKYYENHDEKKDYQRKYYQANHARCREWARAKNECVCGRAVANSNFALHLRSKIHARLLAEKAASASIATPPLATTPA